MEVGCSRRRSSCERGGGESAKYMSGGSATGPRMSSHGQESSRVTPFAERNVMLGRSVMDVIPCRLCHASERFANFGQD